MKFTSKCWLPEGDVLITIEANSEEIAQQKLQRYVESKWNNNDIKIFKRLK